VPFFIAYRPTGAFGWPSIEPESFPTEDAALRVALARSLPVGWCIIEAKNAGQALVRSTQQPPARLPSPAPAPMPAQAQAAQIDKRRTWTGPMRQQPAW